MKNVIMGVGKIQNDFEYIFNGLEIDYYIWSDDSIKYNNDMRVVPIEYLEQEEDDLRIIICSRNRKKCADTLETMGYTRPDDYIYAEDMFQSLDLPLSAMVGNRDILLWGTAVNRKATIDALVRYDYSLYDRIIGYVDSDECKWNTCIEGLPVFEPNRLFDRTSKECFVIVSSNWYPEIRCDLESNGFRENIDYIDYQKLLYIPSVMLKKTIYAVPEKDNKCLWPFEHANVQPWGVFACGWPSWLTTPIGNIMADETEDIWNSNIAKIIRLSMLNHTYSFCMHDVCPYLELKPEYDENYIFDRELGYAKTTPEAPNHVTLSYDNACNLKCLSCRQERINCHSTKHEETLDLVDKKLVESGWLEKAGIVCGAGQGEVFFSPHYRKIVLDSGMNRKGVLIQTNGTIIREEDVKRIVDLYDYVEFYISIDAAKQETFRKLRTGDWNALVNGLELVSKYRAENKINRVRLSFVVQRDNYSEIIDFIKLAKKYGFDWIYFSRIQNFAGWPEDEYWEKSMIQPDGSMKDELIEVFKDPLINDEIVDVRQFYRNLEISKVSYLIKEKKETMFWGE